MVEITSSKAIVYKTFFGFFGNPVSEISLTYHNEFINVRFSVGGEPEGTVASLACHFTRSAIALHVTLLLPFIKGEQYRRSLLSTRAAAVECKADSVAVAISVLRSPGWNYWVWFLSETSLLATVSFLAESSYVQ